MSLGRIVPWCGWEEWFQVGHYLLSGDEELAQKGLDRVIAWRARGRVPLGVDATASLIETTLMDMKGTASDFLIRMQYSMAIVRMVNGIADSSQKGKVAASVASLASHAGLPRLLVDIRHEATHNDLPSIASLRQAKDQALGWLNVNYWQRQKATVDATASRIAHLLATYVSLQLAAAGKSATSAIKPGSDSDESDADEYNADAVVLHEELLGPESEVSNYNAIDAKKQRRLIIAELKTIIPKPAASLLTSGLITIDRSLRYQHQSQGQDEQQQQASVVSAALATNALTATLQQLAKVWPQLPAILLQASVKAAFPGHIPHTSQKSLETIEGPGSSLTSWESSPWRLWQQILLPPPELDRNSKSKTKTTAAATTTMTASRPLLIEDFAPSVAQVNELLQLCLSYHYNSDNNGRNFIGRGVISGLSVVEAQQLKETIERLLPYSKDSQVIDASKALLEALEQLILSGNNRDNWPDKQQQQEESARPFLANLQEKNNARTRKRPETTTVTCTTNPNIVDGGLSVLDGIAQQLAAAAARQGQLLQALTTTAATAEVVSPLPSGIPTTTQTVHNPLIPVDPHINHNQLQEHKEGKEEHQAQVQSDELPTRKCWRRGSSAGSSWAPCALGAHPSLFDPNGQHCSFNITASTKVASEGEGISLCDSQELGFGWGWQEVERPERRVWLPIEEEDSEIEYQNPYDMTTNEGNGSDDISEFSEPMEEDNPGIGQGLVGGHDVEGEKQAASGILPKPMLLL